jgi:hypothetical protein
VDRHGYPLPFSLWDRAHSKVTLRNWPTRKKIAGLMRDAARDAEPAVRQAVGQRVLKEELKVWYSSHVAASSLPEPWEITDALAATLGMADERNAPGPGQLPDELLLHKLGRLERHLWRIRH